MGTPFDKSRHADRRDVLLGVAAALFVTTRPALAMTVRDALGQKLAFARPPQRLVVLYPAMAETVFALGVADRVVGVGGSVKYPPEAVVKPDVGGRLGLSAETIASLKPDLIVVAAETGAAASLAQPMAAAGIPMLVLSYPRIDSIFRNLALLGEVLGVEARARDVIASMKNKIAAVDKAIKGQRRPRVYLETGAVGAGSFQTIGPGHYADDSLRLAGGRNAFPTLRGASQVTSESIALADPDRMVILSSDPALTVAMLAQRPGWEQLRAIRSGNVVIVPRGFILIPGPRQGDAVTILARAIHPGLVLHAP